jgi:hypothetical protein
MPSGRAAENLTFLGYFLSLWPASITALAPVRQRVLILSKAFGDSYALGRKKNGAFIGVSISTGRN